MARSLLHFIARLIMAFGAALAVDASDTTPRLVITQVGLHFICTADGQPDMYSWRIPQYLDTVNNVKHYKIPVMSELELQYAADAFGGTVSGGRTALQVDETVPNQLAIVHRSAVGFGGPRVIVNAPEVEWGNEEGLLKSRYYSNFPPLSRYAAGGLYGTVPSPVGDANYGRRIQNHPGYDSANWNYTLDPDTPLGVEEKRVQALLYLELYLSPTAEQEDVDFTLVFRPEDLASIEVNGLALFSANEAVVLKLAANTFPSATEGGFAYPRGLMIGRRVKSAGSIPADVGFDPNETATPESGVLNCSLVSSFFTANRFSDLSFSSGEIAVEVFNSHDWTTLAPAQRIRCRLPQGRAPAPDLVTAGSFAISYLNPTSGGYYLHPAIQAPRWWCFHRDGSLGRLAGTSIRGRLFEWPGTPISFDPRANHPVLQDPAISPSTCLQSVPGARSLIYTASTYYGSVRQQVFDPFGSDPLATIRYGPAAYDELASWDRPWHFGSDTVRTVANINQLKPKASVASNEWILPPGYDTPTAYTAYGLGFDLPVIIQQPVSQQVTVGQPASFNVQSTSTKPVTYQWRRSGEDIPGATGNSIAISAATGFEEGPYDVVVTGAAGAVTSRSVALNVITPVVTVHPQGGAFYAGQSTTLSVEGMGTGPVTYSWWKDERQLVGETSNRLILNEMVARDAGVYRADVHDAVRSATSGTATIEVLSPAPRVSITPATVDAVLNSSVTFTAEVTGLGAPANCTYQWRRNGVVLTGAKSAALTLTNLKRTDEGVYDVVVKNVHGTGLSNPAKLTLPAVVNIVSSPQDAETAPGGTITLTVQAVDATAYQWLKDGKPIKDATGSSLALTHVGFAAAGSYSVTVTTANGKVTTAPAQVRVTDTALLVYKLTGTGTSHEGTVNRSLAVGGYLVLDRAGQRGALLLETLNGRQLTHRMEMRNGLKTRSTGPVPGSRTVVSEMIEDESVIWLSGADSLVTISKTDQTVGPKTLAGQAHQLRLAQRTQVEMKTLNLVLDAAHSATARLYQETVEQAAARISQAMEAKGSALIEE